GQASLLTNEGGGIGIVPILAVAAAAGGAIVLLSDGDSEQASAPPPPPPPANRAPAFASATATATVAENIATTVTVFDANATDADNDSLTYTLSGTDAAAFAINAQTGVVTFRESPDFEDQASYTFNVVAADGKGGTATQAVTVTVTDVVEAETVNLDTADTDNNTNTANIVDAADADIIFTDDVEVASNTIIRNFEEGDVIRFTAPEDAEITFSTGADDENDLEISINIDGIVSEIVLDNVLTGDEGFIFDEASAEAALGFDFFEIVAPV